MKTQMKNKWKNNFKHFHSVAWCESYKVFIPAWFQRSFFWNRVCFRQVIFRLDHAKCLQCVLDLLPSVNAMGDLQRLDFNKFSCGHVQWLTNGCLTYRLDLFHSLHATWDELHIRELWLGENFWVPAQPTLGTMPAFLTQGCGLSTPLYGDFEIRTLEGCCNSTDLETCWLAESLVWEFTTATIVQWYNRMLQCAGFTPNESKKLWWASITPVFRDMLASVVQLLVMLQWCGFNVWWCFVWFANGSVCAYHATRSCAPPFT